MSTTSPRWLQSTLSSLALGSQVSRLLVEMPLKRPRTIWRCWAPTLIMQSMTNSLTCISRALPLSTSQGTHLTLQQPGSPMPIFHCYLVSSPLRPDAYPSKEHKKPLYALVASCSVSSQILVAIRATQSALDFSWLKFGTATGSTSVSWLVSTLGIYARKKLSPSCCPLSKAW